MLPTKLSRAYQDTREGPQDDRRYNIETQGKGSKEANKEAVNKIEKLYQAIHDRLHNPDYSTIVNDSLKFQIFGHFDENYSRFLNTMNGRMQYEYINYFVDRNDCILYGDKMAIYRSMLYFNLPWEVIQNGGKPQRFYSTREV